MSAEGSDSVACPHCGARQSDLWDHDWRDAEIIEVDCGECDKPYLLSRIVSVHYSARPLEFAA